MTHAINAVRLPAKLVLLPWLICTLGALFYCYEYLLRIAPSVMTSDLMQAYHINATVFGNLAAFYYYAYTPMQLPVGMLMDRYGPRRLLTFACLACALGSYLFGHAFHLQLAQVGRFMVGFGSAFAFVGVLKLATIWLSPRRFALVSGLATSLGMIGGMVGVIYLTSLVNSLGWRATVLWSALVGVALALAIFFVIRDQSGGVNPHVTDTAYTDFKSVLVGAIKIFKKPQMWLCGIVGAVLYLSLSAFAELWGIPYLKAAQGLTNQQAAVSVSMVFLGWTLGGPFVGWVSDAISRRLLPVIIGSMGGAITISLLLFFPGLSISSVNGLLFLFGVFSSAEIIVFAIARESCPAALSASALAIVNMLIMFGGVLFQPLTGYFLDLSWTGELTNGVRHYTGWSYQVALASLPISFILAAILTFFMRETYCRVTE